MEACRRRNAARRTASSRTSRPAAPRRYGKVADAAAKLDAAEGRQAQGPEGLEDRRQAAQAARHADKLTGKQIYGIDVKLPGMLIAVDQGLPGARRQGEELRRRQGRRHAGREEGGAGRRQSGVAVVADTCWHAKTALDALPIEWDDGEAGKVSSATIAALLKEGLDAEQAFVGNKAGDAKAAIAGAAKKVEAVYAYPYQNHATMEPMNATALYTADKCEVWGPTAERRGGARRRSPRPPACRPTSATSTSCMLRRRLRPARRASTTCTQAVLIAKQMPGTPIKLIWSREEDMTARRATTR